MATFMIKVAGEGLVNKAHRHSDPGPTTGSSVIYEVQNVPEGTTEDEVVAAVKKHWPAVPHNDAFEVEFAALA
ncbi:hypothetical protein ACM64Y_07395 [Novispirillum sp. DQ9]|uniref:hypothetical protein n=1 Tax=Novispirillum sp. DQ9 TaxID=3398612 RepID=UPI003C7E68BF